MFCALLVVRRLMAKEPQLNWQGPWGREQRCELLALPASVPLRPPTPLLPLPSGQILCHPKPAVIPLAYNDSLIDRSRAIKTSFWIDDRALMRKSQLKDIQTACFRFVSNISLLRSQSSFTVLLMYYTSVPIPNRICSEWPTSRMSSAVPTAIMKKWCQTFRDPLRCQQFLLYSTIFLSPKMY